MGGVEGALAKLSGLDLKNDGEEFRTLLQSVAGSFAEIRPGTKWGEVKWERVVLNRAGKGVDALRFTTPTDGPRNLVWAFVYPKGMPKGWGIRSTKGRMYGFKEFEAPEAEAFTELPGIGRPAAVVLQRHAAEHLKPGREYLLWFRFKTSEPVEMQVGVDLVRPEEDTGTIAEALGLK
jgi:hypothetical protein